MSGLTLHPQCLRNVSKVATYQEIFYKLVGLAQNQTILNLVISKDIQKTPKEALLNFKPPECTNSQVLLLMFLFTAVRQTLAKVRGYSRPKTAQVKQKNMWYGAQNKKMAVVLNI